MDNTSLTLLDGIHQGAADAWLSLDRLYRPFLLSWFRSKGVRTPDADDLTQDVLVVLVEQIDVFRHSGRTGAFRAWLGKVCTNRLLSYLRNQRSRKTAIGGVQSQVIIDALEQSTQLSGHFERQHDQAVISRLFSQVSTEFTPTTMTAFRRLTLDAAPASQVAEELDLSLGAVYIAKSRVLARLRQLASGVLDESLLS